MSFLGRHVFAQYPPQLVDTVALRESPALAAAVHARRPDVRFIDAALSGPGAVALLGALPVTRGGVRTEATDTDTDTEDGQGDGSHDGGEDDDDTRFVVGEVMRRAEGAATQWHVAPALAAEPVPFHLAAAAARLVIPCSRSLQLCIVVPSAGLVLPTKLGGDMREAVVFGMGTLAGGRGVPALLGAGLAGELFTTYNGGSVLTVTQPDLESVQQVCARACLFGGEGCWLSKLSCA